MNKPKFIRILNIEVDGSKHAEIALTAIYGCGRSLAKKICAQCNLDPQTPIGNYSNDSIDKIRSILADLKLENDLRKEVTNNIKNLIAIKSYRGRRHRFGLPVRGQNTHTNAQTAKKLRRARII